MISRYFLLIFLPLSIVLQFYKTAFRKWVCFLLQAEAGEENRNLVDECCFGRTRQIRKPNFISA